MSPLLARSDAVESRSSLPGDECETVDGRQARESLETAPGADYLSREVEDVADSEVVQGVAHPRIGRGEAEP